MYCKMQNIDAGKIGRIKPNPVPKSLTQAWDYINNPNAPRWSGHFDYRLFSRLPFLQKISQEIPASHIS
jgi:hypothetical protein